ncbi:MAG: branched-chain amino acid aminotransferase [Solirubrobacterales bacterium]|jgi:branched-chain amino acid aminotransferase|nr:branched-chain amino acid aminotransferase [Solirubrobacterales bacterium]
MSEAAASEAETARRAAGTEWQVREAVAEDAVAVAAAVGQLLVELSGGGPAADDIERATRELVRDREMGALLVADTGGEDGLVGVLAASWQHAIHVPGRYGTIQDLWVHPEWRSKAIGHQLVDAFCELARDVGAHRIEVGLPREDFEHIGATEAFYRANGFEHLGPRMRRKL